MASMPPLESSIQVNLPFGMIERFGPLVLELGLGAEIGLDARVLEAVPDREYRRWAERLAGLALTAHAPFMDLAPGGLDPAVVEISRRRLIEAARVAGLFGARAFNCHANYDPNRYAELEEPWLETSAETWRLVLAATEAGGLPVVLENVYETDPEVLGRLLERVGHPRLGFCFDTGHFNVWGRAPLTEWLERLGPWLRRLHLHDNDGAYDHHWAIGRGCFDFEALFDWLKRKGLRPGITLEPHREEDFPISLAALKLLLDRGRAEMDSG